MSNDLLSVTDPLQDLVPETWPDTARRHLSQVIEVLRRDGHLYAEIERTVAAYIAGWELRKRVTERDPGSFAKSGSLVCCESAKLPERSMSVNG